MYVFKYLMLWSEKFFKKELPQSVNRFGFGNSPQPMDPKLRSADVGARWRNARSRLRPIFYNLVLFLKKIHNWTPGKFKCRNGPRGSAPCIMAPRFHVSAPWITAPRSWHCLLSWIWRGRRRARRHRSRRRAPCYKSADNLRYPWTRFIFSSPLSALSLQKPSTNLDSIFGPSKVWFVP